MLANKEDNRLNIQVIKYITWWGLSINLLVSLLKFVVGYAGHSDAVIADGVHSLSDTVTDIAILLGVKIWSAPPDAKHPYGHFKIETIVTSFISIVLAIIAVGMAYEAIVGMMSHNNIPPSAIALVGPIVCIGVKEWLFRWNINVGKKIKSSSLIANAWHHRSDVISSVMALIAVAAGVVDPKLAYVDNIGALIVSLIILKVAWDILAPALSELIDAGASEKIADQIRVEAVNFKSVKAVHAVRTRKTGSSIFADMHILVDESLTVKDGHAITEQLKQKLIDTIPDLIDIVIHIEPFNEEELRECETSSVS